MLFEKVKKKHILQAIKDYEEKGFPNGFGASSTYDLVYHDTHYPPKAIMAYANFHAEGRTIEPYFKGGLETDCFKAFESNGFMIVKKDKAMINYKKYEKTVYDWLNQKNKLDPNFTFSLRQNGSKGAELDYFIGTEKSRYFAVTFWTLPVGFPGSSGDCIGLIFKVSAHYLRYSYDFKLSQTNSPHDDQNTSALNIIKSATKGISDSIGTSYISDINNKMYTIRTTPKQEAYNNLEDMLKDIDEDLSQLIPIINNQIDEEKKLNPEFEAHRISKVEFGNMKEKLQKRFEKYKKPNKINNYWIFQGSPDIYNITNALKAAHLTSWKVVAHKDKIKIGDKVILWQAGANAGCYSLAEVTSEVSVFEVEPHEKWYYTNKADGSATDRVKIKILKYFAEDPILWEDLKHDPLFSNFKAGNQGTNFRATQEEFDTLFNWNENTEANLFTKTKSKLDAVIFEDYIAFIKLILKKIGIRRDDPRVVYSVRGYSLNFIVGQKYCVNVFASKSKENFGVISTQRLSEKSEEYAGKSPVTYYNYLNAVEFSDRELESIIDAIKSVLKKTIKSGFYKSNNNDFVNFLFGDESISNFKKNRVIPKNQILYGPPGTGKTYHLKEQLFDKYTLKENSITQEKYLEEVVANLTWWQVITLALIEIGTSKVNDILENRWVAKKAALSESKNVRATIWGTLQMHTIIESENVAYKQRQNPLIFDKTNNKKWQLLTDEVKEQIPEVYEILNDVNSFEISPQKEIKNYDFVTFHQSFAYEDFIEGIKPIFLEEGEESNDLGYTIENGVFKSLCIKAKNDPNNRYAIFIDEINRGNVSAIFGELITLIETDKRSGEKNALSIKLPYSKKEFSVPSNVDIYGTMNTADRSVEALDTALRRRFEFKEMMPNYEVVENEKVKDIQLSEVLRTINARIELLIDRDHSIGHSYFVGIDSKKKLANAFNNKIVPLLQEYFYGDYGKIGLVLGKGFVEKQKNDKINFADFSYENANDFKTPSFILKKVTKENIVEAVTVLLGKNDSNLSE